MVNYFFNIAHTLVILFYIYFFDCMVNGYDFIEHVIVL